MRLPFGRNLTAKAQPPAGLIGPDAVEVAPRRIRVGDVWCETVAVTGYPREVGPGWLTPLLAFAGEIDVSLHVEPVSNDEAARHLHRQLARFESTRRIDERHARTQDITVDTAAQDAVGLAGQLARGEGRLFRVGLYVTARARTEVELDSLIHRLRAICSSMLLQTRPVTFRAEHGWLSALPLGIDRLRLRRTFDTKALACAFPFASAELEAQSGILYGQNAITGAPIHLDRFALENHNQVVLARSGAGKSYLAKLEILRSLYEGVEVLVVDPEQEYVRLAEAVGGRVINLGAAGVHLNPLELAEGGQPGALESQALFVHSFVAAILGELTSIQRAVLDRAITTTYLQAGISYDIATHDRPAPRLVDLVATLRTDPDAVSLAARLEPFASGSHRHLFDGATNVGAQGHLSVFGLRELPDELRAAGTLVALNSIWQRVSRGPRTRRLVVVDEAWLLLRDGSDYGARFLQRLAKSARKYWCGLMTVTQDVTDVTGSELGRAVLTNAAHHVLLGQSPQAIEELAQAFDLSHGERSRLLTCDRGEGLLIIGRQRAALRVVASATEHRLVTSDPAELHAMELDR